MPITLKTVATDNKIQRDEPAGLILTGHAPYIKIIANFAWQHLKAATIFRDRVIAIEGERIDQPVGPFFEEIRSYVSGCLLSAAACLEAFINELYMAHNSRPSHNFVAPNDSQSHVGHTVHMT
jgi:hypothetical protein